MASDADFRAQVEKTLAFEGGYVDDPYDPGGETNYGITKASYPDLDIAALKRDDAIAIYYRDYWQATGIHLLNGQVAAKVLDLAINMGSRSAIRLLQRACNEMHGTPLLDIDGALGPITLHRANTIADDNLVQLLRNEAHKHYLDIVAAHPASKRFLRGWLRRALA